jgi:hypothetical protein
MYDQYLAAVLAYRGHLHEAFATNRRLLLEPGASRFTEFQDRFVSLSLLGVIPDSLAAATFRQAFEPRKAWPMPYFGTARQLGGLPWWLARKDTASLARFARRAEQEVQRQEGPRGKLRARYLHAAATAYLALARPELLVEIEAVAVLQTPLRP